ncbi:MAG TPA: PspC domain-containing protein [Oscillospiraceae bacterium]|nr:PspC domain-containing protein [Oscillospiraceae bacterium]
MINVKNKKLYKSTNNKMFSGVCAGFADFIGIDPTIVRVIYALASFFTGGFPGVIIYIMLAIIIPEDNGMIDTDATNHDEEEK